MKYTFQDYLKEKTRWPFLFIPTPRWCWFIPPIFYITNYGDAYIDVAVMEVIILVILFIIYFIKTKTKMRSVTQTSDINVTKYE